MEYVLLKDILTESKILSSNPNPDKRITVRLNTNGVEKRALKNDKEGATKYYIRSYNQFIYGKQNLFKGAFGIIPKDLDGFETSLDLPCFDIDTSKCSPEWLIYFLKQGDYYKSLEKLASGAGSKRVSPTKFLEIKMPLPKLNDQERLLIVLNKKNNKVDNLKLEIENQQNLLTKLKQSILQEAIEGKLTSKWREQNQDIEPASVLLEKILAEKEQLIKEKKIKKSKPLAEISEDEIPFDIPNSWEWCRLGKTIEWFSDYHANGSYKILKENVSLIENKDYAIMLRTTNFHEKNKDNFLYINEHAYNFLSKTKLYPEDIIMNKIADPGKVFFVQDLGMPMSLAMNLFLLRFNSQYVIPKYAYYYLKSNYEYIFSFAAGSSTLTITKDAVNALLFTLPPLEEQKEIVNKIENLFAICDELEEQINSSKQNTQTLMQSVLKEAFER